MKRRGITLLLIWTAACALLASTAIGQEWEDDGMIGEDELLEPDWDLEDEEGDFEEGDFEEGDLDDGDFLEAAFDEDAFDGDDFAMAYPDPDATAFDWIFYHYGSACFGMDWRFLRAVARAESGLDTEQRTGSYVGLFQWKKADCAERQNMGPFTDFLTCDDLTDPEANTLVSAHRFHRMFTGERFIDGVLQSDRSWPNAMLDVCPDASAEELVALAYVGHNNGPGVLKHALRFLRRSDAGCGYEQQERAVRSYYETSSGTKPATEEDVERCNQRRNVRGRPNRMLTVGMRHRKCVTAGYGVDKWKYGIRKIVPFVEKESIERLYHPSEVDPDACPIYDGERLYDLADLR